MRNSLTTASDWSALFDPFLKRTVHNFDVATENSKRPVSTACAKHHICVVANDLVCLTNIDLFHPVTELLAVTKHQRVFFGIR